ncbi:hypothetical protein [Glaciihabitans sp. UYNi722]
MAELSRAERYPVAMLNGAGLQILTVVPAGEVGQLPDILGGTVD